MTEHEPFIRQAIELAASAVKNGNHPFGALLVRDGKVILTAENTVNTERDVTGHAELNLVRHASQKFGAETLGDTVLYTSTEPCAMCTGGIFWAGIPKIVFACSNAAFDVLLADEPDFLSGSSAEILAYGRRPTEVIGPVLEEIALEQHRAFWFK